MRFSCQGKQNIWPFSSCPGSCSLRKIKILRSRGHLGIWKASVISINSCSRLEADLLFKSRAIFLYGRVLVLSSSIISDALDGVSSYDWTFPEAGSWRLEVSQVALSMLFSKCFHLAKGVREFCPLDGAASEGATSLNGSSRRHRTCLRYLLTNWLTFNSFTPKNDQKWPWTRFRGAKIPNWSKKSAENWSTWVHLSDIAPNVSFVLRVDGRPIVIGKIHRRRARLNLTRRLLLYDWPSNAIINGW